MDKFMKETDQNLVFRRKSLADEIPDDFAQRILGTKYVEKRKEDKKVRNPDGYTVTINYNKGGYQLIPADDLK